MCTCSCSKSTSPEVEHDRLRAAQPRRVDELEQRPVAHAERVLAAEALEERVDLVALRRLRQPAPPPGRGERHLWNVARTECVAQERADGREAPRDRRRSELPTGPGPTEVGRVAGERPGVDLLHVSIAEPAGEVAEVRAVRLARRVGDAGRGEQPFRRVRQLHLRRPFIYT